MIAVTAFFTGTAITPKTQNGNLQSNNRRNTAVATPKANESRNVVSPTPATATELPNNRQEAKVIRVIDGDTFDIDGGKRVRLIGVDTAESVHPDPNRNTEFGNIASSFSKEKLEGNTVYLEKDVSETDRYGRLLRYVYLTDNTFYNEYLVKEGMAKPSTYPPDVKYADLFVKASQYARENNKGLWAFEGQKPLNTPVPAPTTNPSADGQNGETKYIDANGKGLIKGNINSKGEKIYHLPGGQFYNRTNAEEWFKTEKEARSAGYRKSQR
jgi:micrococcal nuclease